MKKLHNTLSADKIWISVPLILGILSFAAFGLYFYSANHAPYTFIDVILAGPVLSTVGVILSILMRKGREQYPTLWICGLFSCLFGFLISILMIVVLGIIVVAMLRGEWI